MDAHVAVFGVCRVRDIQGSRGVLCADVDKVVEFLWLATRLVGQHEISFHGI